jgi:hypothetical protein
LFSRHAENELFGIQYAHIKQFLFVRDSQRKESFMITIEIHELRSEDAHQTEKSAKTIKSLSILEVISKVVTAVLGILELAEVAPYAISIAVTVIF